MDEILSGNLGVLDRGEINPLLAQGEFLRTTGSESATPEVQRCDFGLTFCLTFASLCYFPAHFLSHFALNSA